MVQNNYKVSILVPIYGVEKYIERCAVSLFEQTYENIEYIFVNDCTKDNSIAILKEVITHYPARNPQVRIIEHVHNKGLGGVRNTAVAATTGEFLMHVDSDDYIDVTCVEKCVKRQIETGADFISVESADDKFGDITARPIKDYANKEEFLKALIRHHTRNSIWGRLIRRSLYDDNDIRVEQNVSMSEDLQVVPRLLYFSKSIAFVHEPLYYYECSNINSYTNSFSESKSDQQIITMSLLQTFFNEHASEYLEAVTYRTFIILYGMYINSAKSKVHMEYNNKVRTLIQPHAKLYLKCIPLPKRIAWHIDNFSLLHVYVKFLSTLKKHISK